MSLKSLPATPKSIHDVIFDLATSVGDVKTVIEFGVGLGNLAARLAAALKPAEMIGVDFNQDYARACPPSVRFELCDLNSGRLDYDDGYFDLGIACEVIEHLSNPDNLMKEASRVIKSGGHFIISTPNLAAWQNRFMLLIRLVPLQYEISWKYRLGDSVVGRPPREVSIAGHVKVYTYNALREHLQLWGFQPLKTKGIRYNPPSAKQLRRVYSAVDAAFCNIPSLSSGVVILSRKTTAAGLG